MLTAAELIAFEDEVAEHFNAGRIRAPVHLSGGNEEQLIEIFAGVSREDWVFCSYRNHYHALLHGVPRERVMAEILAGRSQNLTFPEHNFFTSAMVAGTASIAAGVALALHRSGSHRKVWCFVGDMASTTGAFHEAMAYSTGHRLPLAFIVEDNGMSCDTPTMKVWGDPVQSVRSYKYTRKWPHINTGKWVSFT